MQEQNLTALLNEAIKNPFENKKSTEIKMRKLAEKNSNELSDKKLPDYLRLPSTDELMEMRQWAIDYKKSNKQASKRQIRKATQEHFHINIYR